MFFPHRSPKGRSVQQDDDAKTLLACLHSDRAAFQPADAAGLSPDHWRAVVDFAGCQRVRPLLLQRLNTSEIRPHVPEDVLAMLKATCRGISMRNLRTLQELRDVLVRLSGASVAVMLLKGAHLSTSVYPSAGLREMSDLDILVHKGDVQRAFDVVRAAGYAPYVDIPPTLAVAVAKHAPTLLRADCAPVEIHWSLTSPVQPYAAAPDELWVRAVDARFGTAPAVGLAREDLLLHLCLHASYQHHFDTGLRPLCDIAMLLTRTGSGFDWDAVQERAVRWRWRAGVALTLRLASELLGASVPPEVGRTLTNDVATVVIDAARVETLLVDPVRPIVPPVVARVVSDEPVLERVTHLSRRVFLTRPEMTAIYGDLGFWRRHRARLWRPWVLLGRYGRTAIYLLMRKSSASEIAMRRNTLRQWLRH